MILRSITIEHWRCFLKAVTVGPLDEGLNIIHGPNGTGKSTVFEALCRGLLDGHRVSGKEIETIRPWGRALAPRVVVEFSHNGQTYRIAKQYLESQSARLDREEAGRFTPLAEGAAADAQTRDMLTRNAPGKGLSKSEHWGMAQVLWAPQGALAFSSLSEDLRADIQGLLGAQLSGTGAGPVEERIRARYLEVFTPKGKVRSGQEAPRIEQLRKEIEEAQTAQRQALEAYLAFEDAARRVEECQSRRAYSRNVLEEIARQRDAARVAAENWRALQAERNQRQENAKAIEAQFNGLQRHINTIQTTEAELRQATAERDALDMETAPRAQELKDREQEVARQKAALENARKGRNKVDAARHLAEAARRFQECGRALDALDAHIARIVQAETALDERKRQRNALRAPDAKVIRAARAALKERDDAQLRIESALITLEIVPEQPGNMEVIAGELPGTVALQADMPVQVKGSPEVVVDIPQVARLRAWGPAGAVEEHRIIRAEADKRLEEALGSFGVRDVEALETLAEKARALDNATNEAETIVQTLLSGKSKEGVEQERGAVEAQRRHFLDDHPEWASAPPDAQALESEAAAMERAFIETVEAAEIAWEKAHSAYTAAAEKQETHLRRIEETQRRTQSLTEKLAALANDGRSREERDQALRQLAMGWEAARARLQEIEAQCADYEDDPDGIAKQTEAQYDAAVDEATQAREAELREETRLEQLSARGTYTTLALAEERLTRLEEELRRETLRVEAIRLLHDTVAGCRDEALAAVSGPVEDAATRTFQRIAGRRLGRIQVGPGFAPAAVAPEIADAPVHLDNLSGGEQEQLYLATRLALADALAKHERQMVVLDDVLTATDAGRLARVMTVLEEAAQRLQVIILTCHPERYRGMKNAHFLSIEADRI